MKLIKPALLSIALIAIALLGVGLYLQFVREMSPCPLCILQRYAFVAVAIFCLIGLVLPAAITRIAASLAALSAIIGAVIAGWHLWVKAHPAVSCGIDPLETSLNKIFTAKLMPFLFQADGFCTTEYDPILGLSIPQWSLIWFALFAVVLASIIMRRPARQNQYDD
jgi:disulfide bond formation protein DsbB